MPDTSLITSVSTGAETEGNKSGTGINSPLDILISPECDGIDPANEESEK